MLLSYKTGKHYKSGGFINDNTIDTFEIIRLIGSGSMGKVYLAQEKQSGKLYAVKVLNDELKINREEAIIRFKQEAEIVQKLSHPNIIKLYSVTVSKKFYITMEYFPGRKLREFITTLDLDTKISIIEKIADTIDYIHKKGIIHRDLKPENILVNSNNVTDIRLIDFGLSHFIDIHDSLKKNMLIGSLGYISPEQTGLLKRNVDNRSDLYSLGAIFYEFLCGELPFKDNDIATLLHKHLAKKPEIPSKINKQIPDILDKIILKLLSKEPSERYQSARGLTADLQAFQKQSGDFKLGKQDRITKPNFQIETVGRDIELALIMKKYKQSTEAIPSIVLVRGEAGSGKNRLVDTFKETSLDQNTIFLTFKCSKANRNTPYLALTKMLKQYFDLHYSKQNTNLIADSLGVRAGLIIQVFPFLSQLGFIVQKESDIPMEGPQVKEDLFTGIATLLQTLGRLDKTLVLFVDDIQWADKDSLDFLNYLSLNIKETKLFVILTIREEDYDLVSLKSMISSPIYSSLTISPIDQQIIVEFIARVLNTNKPFLDLLYKRIYDISRGIPLVIMELIKTLFSNNILYSDNGEWELNYSVLKTFKFENSIEDLLLEHLVYLKKIETEILSRASVIGKEFSLELLNELTPSSKKGINQLVPVIDKTINMFLIREDLTREKGTYYFTHDKITEALYNRIPDKDKKRLHLICAKVYEDKFIAGDENALYNVAFHYNKTNDTKKMLLYNEMAFKKAISLYSTSQAIFYLRNIVDYYLKNNQMDQEKISLILTLATFLQFDGNMLLSFEYLEKGLAVAKENAWIKDEINFMLNIGAAYCWIYNVEKAWDYLSNGVKNADKYNILILDSNAYRSIGLVMLSFLNYFESVDFLTTLIEKLGQNNINALSYVYAARACTFVYAGEIEKAIADNKEIEKLLPKIDNQIIFSEVCHVTSWVYSFILQDQGEKALKLSQMSLETAKKIDHKIILWADYSTHQRIYYFKKNFKKVITIINIQDEISKQFDIMYFSDSKYGLTASCYLWEGNFDKAEEVIIDIDQNNIPITSPLSIALIFKVRAALAYLKDDLESCIKILDDAYSFYYERGLVLFNHFNLYFRTVILKMLGRDKESEEAYEEFKQILIDKPGQEIYLLRVFELMEIIEKGKEGNTARISQYKPIRDTLALQNIIDTTHIISSILDIDKLIITILEKALELTGASRGALLLYNKQTKKPEIKTTLNINADDKEFIVPQKIITEAEINKQGVVFCISENGEIFSSSDSLMTQNIRSVLCIPVEFKGKSIGLLYLDNRLLDKLFTKTHLKLLKVFTNQVAVSIDNARAYSLVEKERKHLDEKVRKRTHDLTQLIKLKNDFVAMVSHDLKNTFSGIIGGVDYLMRENDLPEDARKIVNIIHRTVNHMIKISNDFLMVALFDSGKIEIETREVNIQGLVNDVVSTFKEISETNQVKIFTEFYCAKKVIMDESKIFTLLYNLLNNAIKFTRENGSVKITCNEINNNLEIHVIDTGIGITKEKLKEIFSHSIVTSTKGIKGEQGSGVGLSICKKIIELHNGEIGVNSEVNKGSDFWVRIPLHADTPTSCAGL